ncbi:hypothetical protein PMAYCL1PPCAC_10288 [Pristionchus mayeri]|uniref:Carboxylic ester hydrolase n=1 Tax=Pristionchus mayeri TaxID=1317129 RepID=A0AAN4ZKK0_9BILA|nr:hypothetical protein PMAYCL1PPCAC_10288 [Pristionchus mayeri]
MLFLSLLPILATAQEDTPELTVTAQTSAGPVRGFIVDYGNDRSQLYYGRASVFLGIPFAKPPVGDLRFKLPQSLCRFDEEVGSTEYKPRCPQNHDYHGFDYITSEDCLYLNVFTPNISDGRKRAVMFYIPGGMNQLGGADIYHYKGTVRNLVSRDVVVVVTQYRVGTPGFFTTYTTEFPANRAIFDVLLALRWTGNEIANFGGDPDRVTIFGHSSGASIADALSLSPLAKGGTVPQITPVIHSVRNSLTLFSLHALSPIRETRERAN